MHQRHIEKKNVFWRNEFFSFKLDNVQLLQKRAKIAFHFYSSQSCIWKVTTSAENEGIISLNHVALGTFMVCNRLTLEVFLLFKDCEKYNSYVNLLKLKMSCIIEFSRVFLFHCMYFLLWKTVLFYTIFNKLSLFKYYGLKA